MASLEPRVRLRERLGDLRDVRDQLRSRLLQGLRADVDVLACPRCHSRLTPGAVIRRQQVIDRVLQHLALPLTPTQLGHADTVAFDVTGELMPSWVEGVDPEPQPDARAPPRCARLK